MSNTREKILPQQNSNYSEIENVLRSFFQYLCDQQLSKKSIKNYVSDARQYLEWLEKTENHTENSPILEEISVNSIQEYKAFLLSKAVPLSSINRYLASLRQFGSFLQTVHQLKLDLHSISNISSTPESVEDSRKRALKQFQKALESEHCSTKTIVNYLDDINLFYDFFGTEDIFSVLTKPDIAKFLGSLAQKQLSPSTIARRKASLKRFATWANKSKYIKENPLASFSENIIETAQRIPLFFFERTHKTFHEEKTGKKKTVFQNIYSIYSSWPASSYLHLSVLVIFATMIGLFGYQQFFKNAEQKYAFPAALTRPNRVLSFQGRLTDSAQTPITSATNVQFGLYNHITNGAITDTASTAGPLLWKSGTCSITPDQDGIFSTLLGSSCGAEIDSNVFTENQNVYLAITVGAETLTPRQQIATVGYALNSETLQGYPASASAVENTVLIMNNSGDVILGSASPTLRSTSGTFAIEGNALTLATNTGTAGDITIAPDGTGQLNFIGGTSSTDFLNITNANLTTGNLISGTVGNNNTGYKFLSFSGGSSPSEKFYVTATGAVTAANALTVPLATISATNSSATPLVINGTGGQIFSIANNGNIVATGTLTGLTGLSSSGTVNFSGLSTNGVVYTTGGNGTLNSETYLSSSRGGTGANLSAAAQGAVPYFSATGVMSALAPSTSGYVLTTQGPSANPTWASIGSLSPANAYWQLNNKILSPGNSTHDLAIGGNATSSALFQVFGTTGNATSAGTLTLGGDLMLKETGSDIVDALGIPMISFTQNTAHNLLLAAGSGAGNVGIGTTSAAEKLQVNGSLSLLDQTSGGTAKVTYAQPYYGRLSYSVVPNNSRSEVKFSSTGATGGTGQTYFVIGASDGASDIGNNLLLGVSSGRAFLTNAYDYNAAGTIHLGGSSWSSDGVMQISGEPSGTGIMSVIGNVGIGTTTPGAKLDIGLSGTTLGTLRLAGNTSGYIQIQPSASAGSWTMTLPTTGGTNNYVLTTNGSGVTSWSDANSLVGAVSYWQLNNKILSPGNSTHDLAIGGNATSSALFQVFGTTGNATTSGTLTFNSATLANNVIAARNMRGLQIGDTQTGNIVIPNGNVGIGTTNPTSKLQVVTSVGYAARFDSATSNGISINAGDNTNDEILVLSDGNGTERVRFKTGGNIGIGTTTPTEKVEIQNGVSNVGTLITDRSILFRRSLDGVYGSQGLIHDPSTRELSLKSNGGGGYLTFFDGVGTEAMRVTGGNLGIGTTVPGYSLDLGAISPTLNVGRYSGGGNATIRMLGESLLYFSGGSIGSVLRVGSADSGRDFDLAFDAGGSDRIFIEATTGNVGIGTTDPGGLLNINGANIRSDTPGSSQLLRIGDLAAGQMFGLRISSTGTQDLFFDRYYGGAWNQAMMVQRSTGNVGIGTTSPGSKLQVAGHVTPSITSTYDLGSPSLYWNTLYVNNIIGATTGIQGYWQRNGGSVSPTNITDSLNLGATATSSALVHLAGTSGENSFINTGNVGIGTTSPGQKQHVYGTSDVLAQFESTSSNGDVGVYLKNADRTWLLYNNAPNEDFTILDNTAGNAPFVIQGGASSNSIYINSGGNVGIGTTSVPNKLTVTGGNIELADTGSWIGDNTGDNLIFVEDGSTFATMLNSTTTNIFNIDSNNNDTTRYFRWATNTATSTGGSELMRLLENGNLGIGNTDPHVLLNVGSSTVDTAIASLSTAPNGQLLLGRATTDGGALSLGTNGGTYGWIQMRNRDTSGLAYPLLINPLGGNVGIGTTDPSQKLDVNGSLRIRGTSIISDGTLTIDPGGTSGKEKVLVDGDIFSANNFSNLLDGRGDNLAPNPSFEFDTAGTNPPTGWIVTVGGGLQVVANTDINHSGNKVLELPGDETYRRLTSTKYVPVNVGQQLCGYLKIKAPTGNTHLYYAAEWETAGTYNYFVANDTSTYADWTRVGSCITVPAGATGARFWIYQNDFGAGPTDVAYVDDLYIRLGNTDYATNISPIINNGYSLGSSTNYWNTLYVNSIIGATSGIQGYWQRNGGSVSPTNITDSLNLGATATSSALVHLAGTSGENSFINTGNVGIGTTSPASKFEISQANNPTLTTTDSTNYGSAQHTGDGVVYGTLKFNWANGVYGNYSYMPSISARFDSSDASFGRIAGLDFKTANVASITALSILGNGNVGIGTTNPGAKLHITNSSDIVGQIITGNTIQTNHLTDWRSGVNNLSYITGTGGAFFYSNSNGTPALTAKAATNDTANFVDFTNNAGSSLMVVEGGGNVGIGTTNPGSLLAVEGTNTSGTLTLSNSSLTVSTGDIMGQINFYTNDNSSIANRVVASIRSIADTAYVGTDNAPTSLGFFTHTTSAAATQMMTITGSGNVGIGTTTPSSVSGYGKVLEISSTTPSLVLGDTDGTRFEIGSNSNTLAFLNGSGIAPLQIASDAVTNLMWLRGSNVGIGTTTANAKLEVYGGGIKLGSTVNANNILNTAAAGGAPSGSLYWGNRQICDSVSGACGTASAVGFANITGGTNTAAAMVVGNGASLNYTGTGTINASSLGGATWIAPGTIGSTTPNTGAFTTLTASSLSAAGEIRNTSSANASPYTQARITAYRDGLNWGYLGYGSDALMRVVYSSTSTSAPLLFGTSTAVDNTGTFSETMRLSGAGNLNIAGGFSTYDATVADNTIETGQLCLGNGTNCITSWGSGSGRTQLETSRTIGATTGDTVAIGYLSNDGTGRDIKVQLKQHSSGTVEVLTFEIKDHAYTGTVTDWLEIPLASGIAYTGVRRLAVDVYRQNIASTSDPLYIRIRNLNSAGAGTVQVFLDYDDDVTLTELTSQSTTATAFDASTAPAGGAVTGIKGNVEWSFPVSNGNAWKAGSYGMYIQNNGNVGIGTTTAASRLNIGGTIGTIGTGLTFGDGDTGFYESTDDNFILNTGGSSLLTFNGGSGFWSILGPNGGYVGIRNTAGTATAPVYSFSDDSDTGIGHAGANILSLISGGANVLNVTSSNVGIGTTAPTYKLDAREADSVTSGQHYVTMSSNLSVNAGIVSGWYANGSAATGGLFRSIGALPLFLGTSTTPQAMTILDAGNVGIGTTAPTYKFEVANGEMSTGGSNLFKNGDFSLDSLGWSDSSDYAGYTSTETIMFDSTAPVQSHKVLRHTITAVGGVGDSMVYYQDITNLSLNTKYTASLYIKTSSTAQGSFNPERFDENWTNRSDAACTFPTYAADGQWHRVWCTFDTGAFPNLKLILRGFTVTGTWYFTGFQLEKGSQTSTFALNSNDNIQINSINNFGSGTSYGTLYGLANVNNYNLNAAYGTYGQIINSSASATISNAYTNYIANPSNAGTITNNYGLYIANQTAGGTSNYALYSAGGTNYFAGNVGIGTTNPLYNLHVVGTTNLGGATTFGGNLLPSADNAYDIGSTSMRWKTLHVGPGSVVVHNDNTNTAKVDLKFNGSTAQLVTNSTTPLQLTTGTNPGINIDTAGNVGIGTTASPIALNIIGTASTSGSLVLGGDLMLKETGGDIVDALNIPMISFSQNTLHNLILVNGLGAGNVGIGAGTPGSKLSVFGGVSIGSTYGSSAAPSNGLLVEGNVGIGTTTAGSKLKVVGVTSTGAAGNIPASTTGLNLTATAGGAGTASTGIFFGGDGIAHANLAWMPNERNFILRTGNNSTQTTDSYGGANLVVSGTGIFGTGTIDPDSYANQIVLGNIADGSGWGTNGIAFGGSTGQHGAIGATSGYMYFGMQNGSAANTMATFMMHDGATRYTTFSAGNVGIGIGAPAAKLAVSGTGPNLVGSNNYNIMSDSGTTGQGIFLGYNTETGRGGMISGGATAGQVNNLVFAGYNASAWVETMRIKGNGNVGIGTTNPTAKLHISDLSGATPTIKVIGANDLSSGGELILGDDINTELIKLSAGTSGDPGLYFTYGGYINIGQLSNQNMNLITNGTERLTILGGGNVGIGTTNPAAKLHVASTYTGAGTYNGFSSITTLNTDPGSGNYLRGVYGESTSGSWLGPNVAYGVYGLGNTVSHASATATGTAYGVYGVAVGSTTPSGVQTAIGGYFSASGGDNNYAAIFNAGNVGIGTATPGYTFDVNGPGRFVTSLNSSWLGAVMTTNTSANAVGLMSGQVNGTNWTGVAGKSSASNGAGVFGEASHASGYGIYCNSTTNTNGCGGNRAWFNASDSRLKKDIVTIPNALDTVMHLRGVNFNWIEGGQADTGFIAQEVLPYLPQAVGQDSVTGYYGMKTGSLTGLLVEAVKAQQNQMLALTLQGDIDLSPLDENLQTPALKYIPVTTSGENVSTVGTFFKATIANLKAGFISAKDISVDSMTIAGQSLRDYIASVVESLPNNNTGLVQPVVDADIVTTNTLSADLIRPTTSTSSGITIALNNNTHQEISIKDENDNTVSSLDGQGNAEFTGTITTEDIQTASISARFAYLDTIEANTINAKTIRANQIEGMQAILDRIYGASISAQQYSVSELRPQDMPTATESALLADFGTWSASPSATFSTTSIIAETGYFSDYMEVGSHLLIGDASTNQNMIIDGSSLMTSNDSLFIQPSGAGVINVLAGALVIRDTGDIDVRGNVFIAGNLDVKGDTTLFGTLDLAPNPDATGSSKLASLINITDELGNTVATIDASGSATFKDTTLQKLIIAAPAPVATGSGTTQTAQNNASAGSGTIIAGETEVIIPNTGVTPNTLIYLTPQSDTQNQVLYVKNKTVDQGFTVSMNTPLTSDVTFTYWLIETKE